MSNFVLVPGIWLGAWAWQKVADGLRTAGHTPYPMSLTGLAERANLARPDTDLDTHTQDIIDLIETADLRDVILVGHSYGGAPVTAAADRIPDRLARIVYVESGPFPDGAAQWDMVEPAEQEKILAEVGDGFLVPPRAWDLDADPASLAGLDAAALDLLRTRATAHPLASMRQPIRRKTNGHHVPQALIACTFPLEQVRGMIEAGHPFFVGLAGEELVALPTGHWPMLSEPKRLADLLAALA